MLVSCRIDSRNYTREWNSFETVSSKANLAGDWELDSAVIEKVGEITKGFYPGRRFMYSHELGRKIYTNGDGWIYYQGESRFSDAVVNDSCFFISSNDGEYLRAFEQEIFVGKTLTGQDYEERKTHVRDYVIVDVSDSTFVLSQNLSCWAGGERTETSFWYYSK